MYKSQQNRILKFYNALAVQSLLYGSECLTLTKKQLRPIELSRMRFRRSMEGYRRMETKRNTDIRQELNIFNLGERIKYELNYIF